MAGLQCLAVLDKRGDRAASCHFFSRAPCVRAAHADITAKTPHLSTGGFAASEPEAAKKKKEGGWRGEGGVMAE